jgi:hypothetical protein
LGFLVTGRAFCSHSPSRQKKPALTIHTGNLGTQSKELGELLATR